MKDSLFVLLAFAVAASLVCRKAMAPGDWSEFNEATVEGSLEALADADSVYASTMESQGMPAAAETA